MFERHHGGTFVDQGTYVNLKEWEFISVPEEGEYLPGPFEHNFLKIPLGLVLLLGPFLGLAFVIFLPMAVPIVVGTLLVQKIRQRAPQLRDSALKVTTFSQQPGMAYLHMKGTGGKDKKIEGQLEQDDDSIIAGSPEDVIVRLEEDIARRREAGEE